MTTFTDPAEDGNARGARRVLGVIQARMSSRRFPGKVLAPLAGRPVIQHVLDRVARVIPRGNVVVATSVDPSDDPLARFVESIGYAVHRGPLDDTVARLQGALRAHPARWFFRVCGDSPLVDPALLERFIGLATDELDLVTNVHPRSFPAGRSVELVRARHFLALDSRGLADDEREHATLHLYRHPSRSRILNVTATPAEAAFWPAAVDTIEDLARIEALLAKGAPA